MSGIDLSTMFAKKDDWPHAFIKQGNLKQGDDGLPIQEHICVHCMRVWKMGQEPKPKGNCPVRNDKDELRRILG